MAAAAQADRLQSVTLKSREDRKVEVPARDAEFLKLADQFVIEARQVAQDPKRRKPRLKFLVTSPRCPILFEDGAPLCVRRLAPGLPAASGREARITPGSR